MELIPWAPGTGPSFEETMELYRSSFPPNELREEASQRRIMKDPAYKYLLAREKTDWVGLLLCWETKDFIYVEHFCIRPELRGQGYGRKALALLGKGGKPVILEIDPPVDRVSMNRKRFYEGCGYKAAPFAHVHPPYHRNTPGHELVVMSAPGPLSREAYESFRAYLENTVMKDPFAEESVTNRS
ncbi:MAG: GNAT family N-acetyltransferase [Clostridiales bacterium]|nr:GNAT family N-acetyltransferase [Clostridiales bacterium]